MASGELTARVAGSGSFLPRRVMDNFELWELESIRAGFDVERARAALREVENTDDLAPPEVFDLWSRQVTGIEKRRIVDPVSELTTEAMCAEAGRRALDHAGMGASDLDLIVAASLTPSEAVPNVACTVAALLGVPKVGGFVLNAACAGFVHALGAGFSFIRAGGARNVLVVAGDTLSRVTDYADPKTAVLFADGAGAVVLTASRNAGGILAPPCLVSDYSPEHLNLPGQGRAEPDGPKPTLQMGGGPHVLRQAINAMVDVARLALEATELTWDDIDFVIPHQANLRITQGLERQLRLKKGRVIHTIREYGNVSASTVPIALDEVLRGRHGEVPDPARIVLTAVGGGYASGAAVFEWSPPAT